MQRFIVLSMLICLLCVLPGCSADSSHDSPTDPTTDTIEDPDDPGNRWPDANCAATYYVDFAGGNDADEGTSADTAWKHCPGDANATGMPAATILQPGDVVSFRGGVVYRGNIELNNSGSPDGPIFLEGSCWDPGAGKAVIDGSEVVTGWQPCASASECGNNPNWANIYHTTIPASLYISPFTANLHENDDYLWLAQYPNMPDPYFWDDIDSFFSVPTGTTTGTTVTDAVNLNQSEPDHWQNASVALWVMPNLVVLRDITSFDPGLHRITFEDAGDPYTDRPDRYSIINGLSAIDMAGEYCISPVAQPDGSHRAHVWPRNTADLAGGMTISTRRYGINIADHSHLFIEGFQVQKCTGDSTGDGIGIGSATYAELVKSHIVVRNNTIRHNHYADINGYGGIFLSQCDTSLVESNVLFENRRHFGIFVTDSRHAIVRNNTITRAGATAINFFTNENSQIVGNTIADSNGSHANGITLYLGCYNVLIGWNRITDSESSITYTESGNLYFYRNLIDAGGSEYGVIEWGVPINPPYRPGTIAFLNNTFVNTSGHNALGIGRCEENSNVVVNNILDGADGEPAAQVNRSNNIYTGLSNNQSSLDGWSLGIDESVVTDLDALFDDPANGDFHLRTASPAIDAGIDISQYLPVAMFPYVNFARDIDGNSVPDDQYDLGACTWHN